MIKYQFFPRSQGLTAKVSSVIQCFQQVDAQRGNDEQLKSNEMLSLLCPYLKEQGFQVETGKDREGQVSVPVLFGENGIVEKSFNADAWSTDHKVVIEVEAGRAVVNNQFLKDIFQACMMCEVEYLVVAVLNKYVCHSNGKPLLSDDYEKVKRFLETLYVSGRLQLPLKGILLIGY